MQKLKPTLTSSHFNKLHWFPVSAGQTYQPLLDLGFPAGAACVTVFFTGADGEFFVTADIFPAGDAFADILQDSWRCVDEAVRLRAISLHCNSTGDDRRAGDVVSLEGFPFLTSG